MERSGASGYVVEERDGGLFGYELKWKRTRAKIPGDWKKNYPDAGFEIIHRDNYPDFIR